MTIAPFKQTVDPRKLEDLKRKLAAFKALGEYTAAHGFELSQPIRNQLADILEAMDEELLLETAKLEGSIQ